MMHLLLLLLLLVAIVGADLGHLAGLPLNLHKSIRGVGLLMVMLLLQGSCRSPRKASELVQLQLGRMCARMRYCCTGGHQKGRRGGGGAQDVGGTAVGARIIGGHRVACGGNAISGSRGYIYFAIYLTGHD